VEALADDLRKFANALPVSVRPLNAFQRLDRWARRDPRLAAAMALLLLVLLGGIGTTTWQLRRADLAVQRATESNRHLGSIVHMLSMRLSGEPFSKDEIPDAAAVIQALFRDKPAVEVDLLTELGMEATVDNAPQTAMPILDKAERIAKTQLKPDEARERIAMLGLRHGDAAQKLGDYRLAESYYRVWLVHIAEKYGTESIDYAHWSSHMALAILDEARPAEAEEYAQASASILRTKWGAEKDWTLLAEYALARSLLDQGHPAEAIPLLRHAADGYEKLDGRQVGIAIYARYYLGLAITASGNREAGDQLTKTSIAEAKAAYPSRELMGRHLIGALAQAAAAVP
jgi:hypothetical protein